MNRWCIVQRGRRDRVASFMSAQRVLVLVGVVGITCGLTDRAAAGKQRFGGNRAMNYSFESFYENWTVRIGATNDGPVIEATVEIDTSVAHTGVYSVKFSGNADTTKWYAVESEPIPITPGKRYKFSAWTKTEDIKRENEQYHNCNAYIQFRDARGKIVPIGGSPVRRTYPSRGTHDWFDAFAIVVAPEGAAFARLGVTLTCSGTVWFDDVGFYESDDPAWAKRTSEGFVWLYTQGDVPTEAVMEAGDAYLRRLEKVLGVTHKDPITYYKYKSIEQKTEFTKKGSESHLEDRVIHSVKWDERQDVVHILMKQVGRSTLVLAEGIAAYATAVVDGHDVHTDARELVENRAVIPISTFLDTATITLAPRHVMQAEFGSFVGFLVQRDGIEKFKRFFAYPDGGEVVSQVPSQYESVYGATFDEGQRDWILFLLSGKEEPAPASDQK